MILRVSALVAGLAGAVLCSQFPAFSQQYVQRLGGAVDELTLVVAEFDRSAAAEGLDRAAALAQMTGTAFVERRRVDMERVFQRQLRLQSQLGRLQKAGPFRRAIHIPSMDREVLQASWAAFDPALPLTWAGAVFAAMGSVLGYGFVALLGGIGRLTRRAAA